MYALILDLSMHGHVMFISLYKYFPYLFLAQNNFYDLISIPIVNKL
jgi:hypothetical protein